MGDGSLKGGCEVVRFNADGTGDGLDDSHEWRSGDSHTDGQASQDEVKRLKRKRRKRARGREK